MAIFGCIPHGLIPIGSMFVVAHESTSPLKVYDADFTLIQSINGGGGTIDSFQAAVSPDGDRIAFSSSISPYLRVVETTNWTSVSVTDQPGSCQGISFSPDGTQVVLCVGLGVPQRYDPTDWSFIAGLTGTSGSPYFSLGAFSPDGSLWAGANSNSPFIDIWETSGWTKLSNPASLPPASANDVAWSPDGSLLAVGHASSPYVTIYNTSDWSKVTNPATLPGSTVWRVAFSRDGTLLACGTSNSPWITVYNTSDWSKVTNPSELPAGTVYGLAFNSDDSYLALGVIASPYVQVYNTADWSMRTDTPTDVDGLGLDVSFYP